jgi:hypothetical protein
MEKPRVTTKDRDLIEIVKKSHCTSDKQGRDIGRRYQISFITIEKAEFTFSPKLYSDVSPTLEEIQYGKKFVEVISRMTKDGEIWGNSHRIDTFRSEKEAREFIESHFSKSQKKYA